MGKKQPLKGCVLAFCGNFYGHHQTHLLEDAARLGAHTAKSVTKNITHLVTTKTECDRLSSRIIQAQDQGAFVVNLDWMLDSERTGSKQPESKYILSTGTAPNGSASTSASTSTGPTASSASTPDLSKKRAASDSPAPDAKKSKLDEVHEKAPPMGKSQVAKNSSSVRVPLDEGCSLGSYAVYVGDDGVIWDATLNQTNAGKNNNKFYRLQLLANPANTHFQTWTRWGRVGDYGQTKIWGNGSLADAQSNFQKKFKDKSGLAWEDRAATPKSNKYVFLERSYESDSDGDDDEDADKDGAASKGPNERKPPPCTLDPAVQSLMEVIFNQKFVAATMASLNYDAKKMPLGKLSKATIMRGFQTLKDLSARLENPSPVGDAASVADLSNLFYSLIPHHFGRDRPPVINNHVLVKAEIELLETLVDLKDAADVMKTQIDELNCLHPLDRQFRGLGLQEMTPLDSATKEFQLLKNYLQFTRGATHSANYTIENIFRIERQGEKDRFDNSQFSGSFRDRRLLWHGSRATNFGGILSQGLRIAPPEAPVSGYMFGKGVYLADMSSKSAGYCYPFISDGTALLLLCEAELGKPMRELSSHDYNAAENAKKEGAWSTFGKGGTAPSEWADAGRVHPSLKGVKMPSTERKPPGSTGVQSSLLYNEYICYDVAQIRLRYLFQVKM